MSASRPRRSPWLAVAISVVALVSVCLVALLPAGSDTIARILDRFDSLSISAEELITGERPAPTAKSRPLLAADLDDAVEAFLRRARASRLVPYEEFPGGEWPLDVRGLSPVAVAYFESTNSPDGEGVFFVIERHGEWDAGVLVCRQRRPEWKGPHLNGHTVRAGPDFGFRRLPADGAFWHWRRRGVAHPTARPR